MKENWKVIPGLEGAYEASDTGRIRSITRRIKKSDGKVMTWVGRIKKPTSNSDGYCCINISINGKGRIEKVHRLIAKTFIENPLIKPEVNHKNGIKNDNNIENLEWVTGSENVKHTYKLGRIILRGAKHKRSRAVINLNTGIFYDSVREAAASIPCTEFTLHHKVKNRKSAFVYA